jgi:hypothetical protein
MKRKLVVNDRMQQGYIYYRTEPVGRNFPPEFEPQPTPTQRFAPERLRRQRVAIAGRAALGV